MLSFIWIALSHSSTDVMSRVFSAVTDDFRFAVKAADNDLFMTVWTDKSSKKTLVVGIFLSCLLQNFNSNTNSIKQWGKILNSWHD